MGHGGDGEPSGAEGMVGGTSAPEEGQRPGEKGERAVVNVKELFDLCKELFLVVGCTDNRFMEFILGDGKKFFISLVKGDDKVLAFHVRVSEQGRPYVTILQDGGLSVHLTEEDGVCLGERGMRTLEMELVDALKIAVSTAIDAERLRHRTQLQCFLALAEPPTTE